MTMLFLPNPHIRLDRSWAVPYVPLELLSAMATAEAAGARTSLFDVNRLVQHGRLRVSPEIWREAAALVAEVEPEVVLLETWTGTLHNTLLLARQIRRRLPSVPLVLLGAGTSAMAVQVLERFEELDGVVRGEPEPAVALLVAEAPRRHGLPRAPGLVRRLANGGIQDAELAAVPDLDALPRAAYHLALLEPGDSIPVEPGRGCAQGCSFCALAGHWSARHRPRSAESLAHEMLQLGRRYPESVLDLTQDPVYFNDPQRLEQLCQRLPGGGPRWTCHARVDRVDRRQLQLLAAAGCCGMLFGVESGCPAMQQTLGKQLDLTRLEPTVETASRLGIEVRTSFIVGFPDEDAGALMRTTEALMAAREAGAGDTPLQLLRLYPGSPLHRRHSGKLELEPLLQTAGPGDAAARQLVAAHQDLLCASYRLPGALPRGRLLAAWIVLSALPEVLYALWRHGVDLAPLLEALRLDRRETRMGRAVQQLARQILAWSLPVEGQPGSGILLDPVTLADLVSYHLGLFLVGRQYPPDPVEPDATATALLETDPGQVVPVPLAPWRLVQLRTGVEQLVEGTLTPQPHVPSYPALLAKIATTGKAAFYTRRAYCIEAFELDALAAGVMGLCDGQRSLQQVAHDLAVRLQKPPAETLDDCLEVVLELVDAGVLVATV